MKVLLLATVSALGCTALSSKTSQHLVLRRVLRTKENGANDDLASYNFTMPVDHFDPSNKDTYPNRYFVNDTYYKSGGPVIIHDHGEAGIADRDLDEDGVQILPLRLAAKLNGLVIDWEHRYYGYSRPVRLNDTTGQPLRGAAGYKYLTVEQALEDVAYFANNFNKTRLDKNKVIRDTTSLDPYHTPWIFVGGSYPGNRAAWMRIKYPDIIYASYASSAPVQDQFDGSFYYNVVARSMPTNCSTDMKAAIKYFDQTLATGAINDIDQIKAAVSIAASRDANISTFDTGLDSTNFDTASDLANAITLGSGFQTYAPGRTTIVLCDYAQRFNTKSFLKDIIKARGVVQQTAVLIENPGDNAPTENGIAATHGRDGGKYAFLAIIYGIVQAKKSLADYRSNFVSSPGISAKVDDMSWNWQVVSQLGNFLGSDPNNVTVVSKLCNSTAIADILYKREIFTGFSASDFPKELQIKGLEALGGWNMSVSNVMFTNGQFDPWRSYSVASEEVGAPKRTVSQSVPKCNQLPQSGDVFGLVFAGGAHADDMSQSTGSTKGASLDQGLELFLKAWEVWAPCFNQSRDDIRNGKGVDGNGHGANGSTISQNSRATRERCTPMAYIGALLMLATVFAV
ncbi:hypothetical protein QQS21_004267 [Conoideocrella luteorostrata]|uniref:Uncharacterized protein n=1 Tax=Conoideocrella luteorostrata TaxID=1105319 RepID=A0AAJ0CUN2_9HYPO|nr:hypothetical protein QQS21_004267 [Conoideocrella luteorostrata]